MPADSTGTPANQERPATPLPQDDDGVTSIPATDVPAVLANAPHPDQTRMHDVTIDGERQQWTYEKLVKEAQTSAAGRKAFQDASEMRKENVRSAAIDEDLRAVFEDGDEDAFRRVGAAYDIPQGEIDEAVQNAFVDDGGSDDKDGDVVNDYLKEAAGAGKDTSRSRQPTGPVSYGDMAPDVQRALRGVESARMEKIIDQALDNDEAIAYNMKAHTPEGRAAIRSLVDEKIKGRLASYGGDFGDGTRILQEVLPEIKGLLDAVGTPGQQTNMGLGASPGGGSTAGHPPKKPDHVSSTEGDAWEQHILDDMVYRHDKAQRGQQ